MLGSRLDSVRLKWCGREWYDSFGDLCVEDEPTAGYLDSLAYVLPDTVPPRGNCPMFYP